MELNLTIALLTVGSLTLFWIFKSWNRAPFSHLPLPPGPKGLPFIGNLLDMPTSFEWKTYHQWSKNLGSDIISLNVLGKTLIVLDTAEAAMELLEKRSSIYSSRAHSSMLVDLMGWDFNFAFMPYGDRWRRHRRVMHHNFHPTAALRFQPQLLRGTRNLLNRFLDIPDDVEGNVRHMAGEIIMSIAYGLQVKPVDDPYIHSAEQGVKGLVTAAVPGRFLVDVLPILKYIPEWVPGAGFQKKAREWRKWARSMVEAPYESAKRNIANGTSPPSVLSFSLEKMNMDSTDNAYTEDVIKATTGTMYTGGADTTVASITSGILGLLSNPEALKKAQQELDRVVKPGHLPDFDDEENLPYITAVTLETLRWREVAPIAVPHLLDVDDEYKGYRLPAGSIVIANAWAMLHDEGIYPDPDKFNPDRFMKDGALDKSVRHPSHACWGFGRRVCPGRYMADSSVWITIASLIAVFDIKKAVDEHGNVVEPTYEYESALICSPKPYKCSITPRSKETEALIKLAANEDII